MNMLWLRLGLPGLLLLASTVYAQASATIYSYSSACANGYTPQCTDDYRFGDPAKSSASRGESYVPPEGGGYNYSAQAAAVGVFNNFSLYGHAGGSTFEPNNAGGPGQFGMRAVGQLQYHDELTVAGTGFGTIVVPWHITGFFDIGAISAGPYLPRADFGASFCQSIKTGNNTGGHGCTGGGLQAFTSSTPYDMVLSLEYLIEFGVSYSLNTTFELIVGSGAGLASSATADFSHTGLMQAASVYDSNGNLIPDALITAASGLNYRTPQASGPVDVPEPSSLALFGAGILGLGWFRRRGA